MVGRISGVPETEGEKVEDVIVNIARAAGVEMTTRDISACHRLGPARRGTRPRNIICRFVSRQLRYALFQNKKNLKTKEEPED